VIFVTLGTHEQPFPRALSILRGAAIGGPLLIQHGATHPEDVGAQATWRQWMAYEEIQEAISTASAVVSHAGLGTIMTALALGRCPVVIPRLRRFREHVDDHQLEIVRRLAAEGRIVAATTAAELRDGLADSELSTGWSASRGALAGVIAEIVRGEGGCDG